MRDEKLKFNRIDIDGDTVTLTVQSWAGTKFASADAQRFIREGDRWRIEGADREIEQTAR